MLTLKGRELIADLPPWFRDDPHVIAVQHCYGREIEYAEAKAEALRKEMLPNMTDQLVSAWEALTGIVVTTPDMTIEQRREAIMARIRQIYSEGSGDDWVQAVDTLLAGQWTYEEHLPYTNLLANPGVDVNLTGWTGITGTTLTYAAGTVADPAERGGGAANLVRTAAAGTGDLGMQQATTPPSPVGKVYSVAAYERPMTVVRPYHFVVQYRDAGGVSLAEHSSAADSGAIVGQYRRFTYTLPAAAPANTAQVFVQPRIVGVPEGEHHRLDTLMLVEGELPPGGTFVDNPNQGPPAYTIRITVPFPPTSTRYQQLVELVKAVSPAHLDVQILFLSGFVLDASALDLEAL